MQNKAAIVTNSSNNAYHAVLCLYTLFESIMVATKQQHYLMLYLHLSVLGYTVYITAHSTYAVVTCEIKLFQPLSMSD